MTFDQQLASWLIVAMPFLKGFALIGLFGVVMLLVADYKHNKSNESSKEVVDGKV